MIASLRSASDREMLQLIQRQKNVTEHFTAKADEHVDVDQVQKMLNDTKTLVVKSVNHRNPPVAKLCSKLAGMFGAKPEADLVLSPPKAEVCRYTWPMLHEGT